MKCLIDDPVTESLENSIAAVKEYLGRLEKARNVMVGEATPAPTLSEERMERLRPLLDWLTGIDLPEEVESVTISAGGARLLLAFKDGLRLAPWSRLLTASGIKKKLNPKR